MTNPEPAEHSPTPRPEKDAVVKDTLKAANRQWRKVGVRSRDRRELTSELRDELSAALADGYEPNTVLGADQPEMFTQWAIERGVAGKALRLHLVLPSAIAGIIVGASLMFTASLLMFAGSTTFDPAEFILALYAMSGALAYLCALLFTRWTLSAAGDLHVGSTTKWLAILLPLGAVLTTSLAVAFAWWQDFTTNSFVFSGVFAIVIVGLIATPALARYVAVSRAVRLQQT